MQKNVLILGGSPRKDGNSDTLGEAFAKGAKESGHKVTLINVSHYNIEGCNACNRCWTNDAAPCVQSDDMNKLYPMMESADMVVFAMPLYYYSFPSKLKAVIDRFYPYLSDNSKRSLKITESILLLTAATENDSDLTGIKSSFSSICEYLGWQNKGMLLATGVWAMGDISNKDWLDRAKKLGASI